MQFEDDPPDPLLDRELREVREASLAALATLAELNVIPDDFPRGALEDLCTALAALPEGTAGNARPPLELARNALPKLRREHFDIEPGPGAPPASADTPPRFARGMVLDQKLHILLAAVTTALDAYRAQAGIQLDDGVRPDDVAVSTEAARGSGLEAKTEAIVGSLRAGVEQLDTRGVSATEPGGLLRRRLRDGENLALAARSQLRQRTTVARWLDGVVAAFRRTPDLIEKAGKGLQTASHVGEPYVDFLGKFLTEPFRTILQQMRDLGEAMAESVRRLRNGAPTPPAPVALDPKDLADLARAGLPVSDDPDVPDGLRVESTGAFSPESFRRTAGAWARCAIRITALSCTSRSLKDLTPLARLSALQTLDLSGTQVQNLASLAGLSALQTLHLSRTRVEDLAPLSGLSTLQTLNLYGTRVEDLAPLAGLSALQTLTLSNTRVENLAPLAELYALQTLHLSGAQVQNLAPLARLSTLQVLNLYGTRVEDLAPLAGLSALQALYLSGTQVQNLAPLAGLSALQYLDLSGTRAENLASLAGLATLQTLDLSRTKVRNLAPVAGLSALKTLNLSFTGVENLKPLAGFYTLQKLELRYTRIEDLAPLAELSALQTIDLSGVRVGNLAPLAELPDLRDLRVPDSVSPEVRTAFDNIRRARGLPPLFAQ